MTTTRYVAAALTVVGILSASLSSVNGQIASAATPTTPSPVAVCQSDSASSSTIHAFVDAYNRQDVESGAALTSPDFTRYSVTTPRPMPRNEWSAMWSGFVAAFPDERWELQSLLDCGDTVTVRVVEKGTFLRPWKFPDGYTADPTFRSYTADSVIVFRLDPDRRIRSYLQFTTPAFLEVGISPATAAAIVRSGF